MAGGNDSSWVGTAAVLAAMCAAFMASSGYKGRTTVIGVDLGTTYSVVGVRPVSERDAPMGFDDVIIIKDGEGRILQPSNVAFLPDGEILVGHAAKKYRGKDAKHAIFNAKRFIGRHFDEPQVVHDASLFDFDVVEAPKASKEFKKDPANGYFDVYGGERSEAWFKIDVDGHPKFVSPTVVGAKVVGRLAEMVSEYLGHGQVASAVIAVPAKFNVLQRQATELAFKNAGLKVLRIIEEPTAAAMAYGLLRRWDVHFILVFDFGGGTLDVSLLYVNEGSAQVIGDSGDNNLGGGDFDVYMARYLFAEIEKKTGIDVKQYQSKSSYWNPKSPPCNSQMVQVGAELIKIELSKEEEATFFCLLPASTGLDDLEVTVTVTRTELELVCKDLLDRTLAPIHDVLSNAGMKFEEIDELVMVGGSSRIPWVRAKLEVLFDKEPNDHIDPDIAVAYGATTVAH